MSYRRFYDCSVSEKLLYTLFIAILGTGYTFAMILLFVTVSTGDGEGGLSVDDIVIKYSGNRSGTRLEQALSAQMKAHRTEGEYLNITRWINSGASEAGYEEKIKQTFDRKCVFCHSPENPMNLPDLSSYEKVMEVVEIDMGESFGTLVRVSHIHLFGTAIIFYLLGRIFVLTEMPVLLKRTIVVVPFAAIAIDIGSWWFTKYSVNLFAYAVIVGGVGMGLSFALQSFLSFYQMWFVKARFKRKYESSSSVERRGEYRQE